MEPDGGSTARFVWRALRAGGWRTVMTVFATIAGGVFGFALPGLLAAVVDDVVLGVAPAGRLIELAVVAAGLVTAEVVGQYCSATGVAAITLDVRRRALEHLVRAGTATARRFGTGDVVSRIASSGGEVAGALGAVTAVVALSVATAGGVVGLAMIEPWAVAVVVVAVATGWLVARRFVADTTGQVATYMTAYGAVAASLVGALSGIRTIRSAGATERELRRILEPVAELSRAGRSFWHAQGRVSWQLGLLLPAVEFAVLAIVGVDVAAGRTGPGSLLAAAGYAAMALSVLGQAQVAAIVVRVRAGAVRILDVLDLPVMQAGRARAPAGAGAVVLRAVGLVLDGRRVLDRLDLSVPGGASVALVGAERSGPSAVAALVGRVLDPDEGEVLVDGRSLREIGDVELAGLVCTAFARPNLVGGSVRDALRFGSADVTDADVERGARDALADGFIGRLPAGYASTSADAPLSGGELQRLGLARAFARSTRILVLDDAMSSLDTVTEVQVSRALTEPRVGRTTVIVGHRVGTAARCDLVAWLEHGRLHRVGTHDELWADPRYRDLFAAERVSAP